MLSAFSIHVNGHFIAGSDDLLKSLELAKKISHCAIGSVKVFDLFGNKIVSYETK